MALFPGKKAFNSDRIKSWQTIAAIIPDANIQKAINQHVRDIAKLNKITGSGGTARTHSPARKSKRKSPRTVRLCKHCETPLPHKGPDLRRHLYGIRMADLARKSWRNFPPGSLQRKLRMEKAWAARRKQKDARIISQTHPRIGEIFGKEWVIQRGRDRNP